LKIVASTEKQHVDHFPNDHTQSRHTREFWPEVAGDFYLIKIMVILMIIFIFHHGADDYNHMGMQWALQLGLHDGGY